jgi:predicted GIY-YIG superfamily endonuclease
MKKFFYVYILQSETEAQRFYTGLTNNLRTRFKAHNSGRIVHTAKWKPWQLKTYIALSDRTRAAQLERYLKSASGRAFIITSLAFSVLHRARVVEKSEDCRPEALAQADSLICNCRLPISYFENARLRDSCSKSKIWRRSRRAGL